MISFKASVGQLILCCAEGNLDFLHSHADVDVGVEIAIAQLTNHVDGHVLQHRFHDTTFDGDVFLYLQHLCLAV